jgi:O-acetyl-ADP-ribose deacetylase (regulator of RNase III)
MATIEIWKGNIVQAPARAIVNAANSSLAAGSGVCGAIFDAAGHRELQAACDPLGGCETGSAKATPSFKLSDRGISHIIHAVGPRWGKSDPETTDALLAGAYRASLDIAEGLGLESIAFPPISTGIFGFPKERAADIAVRVCREHEGKLEKILLVAFDEENQAVLKDALAK